MPVDYFINITGVEGESKDSAHGKQIDVLSFSWGANQPGTFAHGSGGTAGKVSMSDLSFTMQTCKATPQLMAACASGKHFDKAELFCRKSTGDGGQQEYMKWELKPVIISGYQTGGSSGAEIPIDSVSVNYGSVHVVYSSRRQGQRAASRDFWLGPREKRKARMISWCVAAPPINSNETNRACPEELTERRCSRCLSDSARADLLGAPIEPA